MRIIAVLTASLPLCLLAACSDDTATADPPEETPECIVMTDDDADPDQIEGAAGCYTFTARGTAKPALAELTLPAGYGNFGHFALWPTDVSQSEDTPFRAVQYWTVHGVDPDPCNSTGAAPQIGPSVEDLAEALDNQKHSDATEPVPVTLDGHEGVYLELSVHVGRDPGTCSGGYYFEWEGSPGDAQHTVGADGTVERIWIVDVDGVRVVLVAIAHPGVTPAEFDELSAIVESVRFVEA